MPTESSQPLHELYRSSLITNLLPGIHTHPTQPCWMLITENSTYALGVTPEGLLLNLHWGARLTGFADLSESQLPPSRASHDMNVALAPEEYPAFGGLRYGALAAKATFADDTREMDLRFVRADVGEQKGLSTLFVHLKDAFYPLEVILCYRVDIANDLLMRSVTFHNTGEEPIILERAFSATWHLPRQFAQRQLLTLAGHWAGETRIQRQELVSGNAFIESRKGVTGAVAYPWFAIETQDSQEVYFGTLAWSGNWAMHITTTITGATAITGGIHDHDFSWRLESNTSFETPEFVAGFASDGLDGSRHRFHRYVRQHVLPQPQAGEPRPVLYNSWEATTFNVNEEGQARLAERAAQLGVELFVVDDGWFIGRKDDHAGLGDWYVDPVKFPRGLRPLVEQVQQLGMQFGLWVEPEMVNPDSELYRTHPEWVYHYPHRPRSEARNQLVLNVGRQDVQDYLLALLDALIAENDISFIKWDMNRPLSEAGWPEYITNGGEGREVWVRHVRGVYAMMDALRARHPGLSIESCAGGGSRADLGILERTDQVWTSDNTHPDARLFIQEGISLVLPARVMGAWVTDMPSDRMHNEIPLAYRFHVAMTGMLGIGGHLLHWSEEDLEEATRWIAMYKQIRPLVQTGDQTWLLSPTQHAGDLAAIEYSSPDRNEAVIFTYRRTNPFWEPLPRLRLQHLHPDRVYTIKVLGQEQKIQETTMSGAALMHAGLSLPLRRGSYASCVLHLQAV